MAFRKSLPRLKKRGLLVADNVLWSGRVTESVKDQNTRGIQEFNRMIYASKKVFPVIVPLRDGLAICQKG